MRYLGCWSQFKHEDQWVLDDSRTLEPRTSSQVRTGMCPSMIWPSIWTLRDTCLGSTCSVPHVFIGVKFNRRMSLHLVLSLLSIYQIILCFGFLWGNYKSFAEYEDIWCSCVWHTPYTPILVQFKAASGGVLLEFGPSGWRVSQGFHQNLTYLIWKFLLFSLQIAPVGHARAAGPPFGALAQRSPASLWCCDADTATSLEDIYGHIIIGKYHEITSQLMKILIYHVEKWPTRIRL